jgi:uncharacterized membrane protein YkoI
MMGERRRTMSAKKTRWLLGVALAVALIGGGTAIAVATGGDDDKPLTGSNLKRATAEALAYTGGGTVIETEVGDDGAAYGVEIQRDDGSVVEVSLDANFKVIGDEADDDGANEQEGPEDD